MGASTMAATAGAVVLLYYVLTRRFSTAVEGGGGGGGGENVEMLKRSRRWRPVAQAPATWMETISMLAETVKFTYSETLGKWPIGDLAFGIKYLIKRQGNLPVASLYAKNCPRLRGPEIISRLYQYLRLLTLCMFFSKKPFPVFLESAGFSLEDVLLQKPKAGLLKPAFTIICDKESKCFLLLIRGTHSIKDTLTAATGTVVPFHHSVLNDGGVSNLILGYAHCGMVAAARWISNLSKPFLLKGLAENPDYEVKVVGHSLGGGTAALLTYILREQKEFSSTTTCVTFAPGACMTWELAESGKHFITTIINGSDLVPTFSAASVDDLRSEVTASSWVSDLRDQVERNRVLNVVYRSATALSSRLPSISNAKAKMAVAGSILRPVSSSTQVVMKRAQDVAQAVVRTQYSLSSWACMGPRRRAVTPSSLIPDEHVEVSPLLPGRTSGVSHITERSSGASSKDTETNITMQYSSSSSGGSLHEDTDEDEDLIRVDKVTSPPTMREIAEGELWYELEQELQRQEEEADVNEQEEAAVAVEEIVEEEAVLADAVESHTPISSADVSDNQHLYPPGKIMHIVSMVSSDMMNDSPSEEEQVGIYETRRELYNKLRLSTTMIKDHYMPMYKKMMELLIRELENEGGSDFET